MVTSLEKFVFASHLRKPKIRNKARDFPKPITSQTLLSDVHSTHEASSLSPAATAAAAAAAPRSPPICVSDESRLALPSSAMSDAAEAAFDLGEYFKDPLSSLYNGLDMAACAYPAREWLYDVHITPH